MDFDFMHGRLVTSYGNTTTMFPFPKPALKRSSVDSEIPPFKYEDVKTYNLGQIVLENAKNEHEIIIVISTE